MVFVNYQKRKNNELFKSLEEPTTLFLSNAQNYIPIYSRFFALNDTNFNSINLNHKWYISNIDKNNNEETDNFNLYTCKLNNITNEKVKHKEVFFKLAPLLDPYKYLIGKYNVNDEKIFNLPKLNSTVNECHPKMLDTNNSAYVDGLFVYLTSSLLYRHKFIHGVDYYGSFLGLKNNFMVNVFDDIDHLNNSDFFNNNKNKLFQIEDYEHFFQVDKTTKKPIVIEHNSSVKSMLSIQSVDNEIFEGVFEDNAKHEANESNEANEANEANEGDELNELIDLNTLPEPVFSNENNQQVTLKSNSSCSSRSSYTDDDDLSIECKNCGEIDNLHDNECSGDDIENSEDDHDINNDSENEMSNSEESSYEDETLYATIPKFPVQVIGMEYCENTFDDLILNEDLKKEEWLSAFMQIIMILITYQKAFGFTHNDLHTNNVMYNHTDKKYIFYCYKKKYYKVPTFGRIFKIIDFGRSIYKFENKLFCSDSFQVGGDAATQYNTEPYLNDMKPRLEPNFSFDLCRLACSIFDYVIEDFEEVRDISKCSDPIKRLIVEWCLDDKGINMLYKNNGVDRYPDFKLYKMIARCVHNHIPQAQLERPEFDAFSKFKGEVPDDVINIDNIPNYM
jgi:hypothetical protein